MEKCGYISCKSNEDYIELYKNMRAKADNIDRTKRSDFYSKKVCLNEETGEEYAPFQLLFAQSNVVSHYEDCLETIFYDAGSFSRNLAYRLFKISFTIINLMIFILRLIVTPVSLVLYGILKIIPLIFEILANLPSVIFGTIDGMSAFISELGLRACGTSSVELELHHDICWGHSLVNGLLTVILVASAPFWVPFVAGCLDGFRDGLGGMSVLFNGVLHSIFVVAFCPLLLTIFGFAALFAGPEAVKGSMSKHGMAMTDADTELLNNAFMTSIITFGGLSLVRKLFHRDDED
ncbi:hypothetical protein [uncultured Treponema sp.]|uniref:hypothetical protein n=1 Tax=uncultured Treponema sp. TaxID=162155 RepID=UPI0025EB82B2|nr:hypothetical protein [uncultured Treponema sp.]